MDIFSLIDYYAAQIEAAQRQQAAQRAQQQQQPQQYQDREHAAQIEAGQRQQAAQRALQQQQQQQQIVIQAQQPAQPVGIRVYFYFLIFHFNKNFVFQGLMNKFTGPTKIPSYEPKPKSASSRQFSSSSYTSATGSGQSSTTTTRASSSYSMTYSSLPKPQEPPVNSAAYFEMLQHGSGSNTSANPQQSAAPPHIQGPAPGFGALRDRFKSGSLSESTNPAQDIRRQQQSNTDNSGLSSLRDHYVTQAKVSSTFQEESFSQRIQNVSQSFGNENQSQQQLQHPQTPPAPPSTPLNPYQEEPQIQSQSIDDQPVSSEGAVADGASSSGASSLEKDAAATETATAATTETENNTTPSSAAS
jgi:hypothetical protein